MFALAASSPFVPAASAQLVEPPGVETQTDSPASLCDGREWDKTAEYNNQSRVRGCGNLIRTQGESVTTGWVFDINDDGNKVYASTEWYRLQERCSDAGAGYIFEFSKEACSAAADEDPMFRFTTAETWQRENWVRGQSWCDARGTTCADNGFKVVTFACVQLGWPVPDRCTYAYVEYHVTGA